MSSGEVSKGYALPNWNSHDDKIASTLLSILGSLGVWGRVAKGSRHTML
jgi:hypothetical protein